MVDLYQYKLGQRLKLSIGTQSGTFVVAGVWRDYVRQTGAITLRLADYRRLTRDAGATDTALIVDRGASVEGVIAGLRKLPFGAAMEFAEPGEIRARTLTIFDRSFAMTYLLEAVAIVIGLFDVATTFSAQTLARAREFGMLRHVGVTRRQVLAILAAEAGMLTALSIAVGLVLGWAISLILVFVVNPQSFLPLEHVDAYPMACGEHGGPCYADLVVRNSGGRGTQGDITRCRACNEGGLVMRGLPGALNRAWRWAMMACACLVSTPSLAAEFATVTPDHPLAFPQDTGAHQAFRTEWWYATGWLNQPDGKPLGFQITFFVCGP